MEKRYFSKTISSPYGWGSEKRAITRYIVTPEEWEKIKTLCENILKEEECKFANSILKFKRPFKKTHESEPDMPENSVSFILYEEEASMFENVCMDLLLSFL